MQQFFNQQRSFQNFYALAANEMETAAALLAWTNLNEKKVVMEWDGRRNFHASNKYFVSVHFAGYCATIRP